MFKIAVTGTRGFPYVQGGVETHCEHLYPQLVKRGCDVTVYTRKPYIKHELQTYRGVKLVTLGCPQNKYLEAIYHTFKSVLRARKLKPHLLHIHAVGPSLFAPLARLLGIKVVLTTQGPDYKRQKWPFLAQVFLRFCEFMGVKYSNEIIAVSDSIAEDIIQKYDRRPVVIPNGVDICEPAQTDEILNRLHLQKKHYILAVGRFVPEKGFHDLIKAFNLFKETDNGSLYDKWKLVIAGDADHEDPYSNDLKKKAEKSEEVVLPGFLKGSSLHELYSHAGIFVISSYHEGLPLVLLEAMSYGLSCIASDIAANRSVGLSDDRYFIPGNIKEMAVKISEFISKPFREDDKEKQIRTIIDKYSWEKIAESTLNVYNSVSYPDRQSQSTI